MDSENSRLANFIIGGTEKAGTTSVFMYLGEHTQVCGSSSKETDFFRRPLSGDPGRDRANYANYFTGCPASVPVIMEASTGYLGEAATVAPRINALIPEARLLFILRDPVDRLYSSYNFHKGKLDIDENIQFREYVEMCLAYDRGEVSADKLKLDEWYLKMLRFGCYAGFLEAYYASFAKASIKVMFFEHLTNDASGFMKELSAFLHIDETFWDDYEFIKTNVTFSGNNKLLHKAAILANDRMESVLRQRPKLKQALVKLYKRINQAREGYDPMPESVRDTLKSYYHPHNQALCTLLGTEKLTDWSC